jgi:branched-chain amino acid transport system permease protein
MAARVPGRDLIVLAIFAISAAAAVFSGHYGMTVLTEIAIFCIFALSIDFLVGYSGLITLGHAGFMGVGAYTAGYVTYFLGVPPIYAPLLAIVAGLVVGVVIGFLVTRVRGVFFIMVTLAFSMLFYSWAFKARTFNGDDGLSLAAQIRPDLSAIGLNLDNPLTFCLMTMFFAVLVYLLFAGLTRTPFGQVLLAIKQNENRIRAQGCPTQLYKVAAFAIAGGVAAFAGVMHLQFTEFLHPNVSHWIKSGEGLIVVIVGGMGSLVGPVIGTYVFMLLHKGIEAYTAYWQIWVGAIFIAIVLFAPDGLYGRLRSWVVGIRERRRSGGREPPLAPLKEPARDA